MRGRPHYFIQRVYAAYEGKRNKSKRKSKNKSKHSQKRH